MNYLGMFVTARNWALIALLAAGVSAHAAPWKFFAMDNGVGRGVWSAEQQASTLQELGYDGISYNYTTSADVTIWLSALQARQLRLFGIYVAAQIDGEPLLPPGFTEAVPLLKGSGAVIWLILPKPKTAIHGDDELQKRVRQIADLADTAGLRVVLYPHFGFQLATAEQAWSLVQRVDRKNVGLTFNLAHELAAGNGPRLTEIIRKIAPALEMVSLNGATDRAGPGWDNYIKVLGTGEFPVDSVLRTLAEVKYAGPVGLQAYNIKGETKANLASSVRAWKTLTADIR
ncbi:MAG: TIM barrel protein [Opitutus sp.]